MFRGAETVAAVIDDLFNPVGAEAAKRVLGTIGYGSRIGFGPGVLRVRERKLRVFAVRSYLERAPQTSDTFGVLHVLQKMRTARFKRALRDRLRAEKKRAKRRAYLAHIRQRANRGACVFAWTATSQSLSLEALYRQFRPDKYRTVMEARSSAVLQYKTALSDDEREVLRKAGGPRGVPEVRHLGALVSFFVPRPHPRFPQAITRELCVAICL